MVKRIKLVALFALAICLAFSFISSLASVEVVAKSRTETKLQIKGSLGIDISKRYPTAEIKNKKQKIKPIQTIILYNKLPKTGEHSNHLLFFIGYCFVAFGIVIYTSSYRKIPNVLSKNLVLN